MEPSFNEIGLETTFSVIYYGLLRKSFSINLNFLAKLSIRYSYFVGNNETNIFGIAKINIPNYEFITKTFYPVGYPHKANIN